MLTELPWDQPSSNDTAATMEWIELPPLESPAEALAWEEWLLDEADANPAATGDGQLWCYESPTPAVVVGYGQKIELEVNVIDCDSLEVPVLRRCSGGGTVVLGPGCLAYGLILPILEGGPLTSINGTNHWVMDRQRRAWAGVLTEPVMVRGHTDLAVVRDGRELKFSGNAQRRRRHHLLFHGTALLDMDLPLITRLLRMPSWSPEYRGGRHHQDFLTNLNITAEVARNALRNEWGAQSSPRSLTHARLARWLETRASKPTPGP